ncbi:hypothetical protein [Methanoregula sp.]|jgi:hypothetical protein|uniref:hypothetical protein n=1 Tax=Methanoregula sp. TaxID=2052170 RepID=UPI003C28540E
MIQSNRTWSVNYSKESLLEEIDDEIQKEYQILNKFSSEKFSIILVIFGFLTIFVSIWTFISSFINETQLVLFYLISANLLILFWSYWEIIKNILFAILKIPIRPNIIGPKISINFLSIFDASEREQFKFLLKTDWVFAKKGEPHSWAFFIFLSTLIGISYANLQGWINIPHLNDSIIFGISVSSVLIIFSIITIFANYYLNSKGILWESLFEVSKIIKDQAITKFKKIIFAILFMILGVLLLMWTFFFYIFPILLLSIFVLPNLPLLSNSLLNNLVMLLFFTLILNCLVEFLAVPYGINLVENIKNEKIWWLERIKLDINAFLPENDSNTQLTVFYKKFDCSDIYVPVPIQRFFIFQKFVLISKWIMKPVIDIDKCDDSDFKIFKERFNFHKNLIYRNEVQ